MAFNATTMKELENLNAKLDLIRKNKDEVNANTANLNATSTHIEGAHPKEDTANDFINRWAWKFIELFDERNTSPPATDPIQPKNNGDVVVTDIQPRLDHKDALTHQSEDYHHRQTFTACCTLQQRCSQPRRYRPSPQRPRQQD
jgi:hypothetical protein